jgi:hypothetical protein
MYQQIWWHWKCEVVALQFIVTRYKNNNLAFDLAIICCRGVSFQCCSATVRKVWLVVNVGCRQNWLVVPCLHPPILLSGNIQGSGDKQLLMTLITWEGLLPCHWNIIMILGVILQSSFIFGQSVITTFSPLWHACSCSVHE